MRWEKAWAISRKELSEFGKNRYILLSLILMPVIITTIMPMVYLVPVSLFVDDPAKEPMDLGLNITNEMDGAALSNGYVNDTRFVNAQLFNMIAFGCEFVNCQMEYSLIRSSNINDSLLNECVVDKCNLDNVTRNAVSIKDSVVVGEITEGERTISLVIDLLMLFFCLIPAIIPTIIASYTFVGEKINRSLEPLLATPTTDLEILSGKTLSIFVPTMAVTWICFLPFLVLVDLITEPVLGYYPLPNAIWIVVVFVLAPLFCLVSILGNVIISSRVSDVRSSQQLGSLVVMPIVAFFVVVMMGVVTLSMEYLLLFSAIMMMVDMILFRLSAKVFEREEILVRWK